MLGQLCPRTWVRSPACLTPGAQDQASLSLALKVLLRYGKYIPWDH